MALYLIVTKFEWLVILMGIGFAMSIAAFIFLIGLIAYRTITGKYEDA